MCEEHVQPRLVSALQVTHQRPYCVEHVYDPAEVEVYDQKELDPKTWVRR